MLENPGSKGILFSATPHEAEGFEHVLAKEYERGAGDAHLKAHQWPPRGDAVEKEKEGAPVMLEKAVPPGQAARELDNETVFFRGHRPNGYPSGQKVFVWAGERYGSKQKDQPADLQKRLPSKT